MVGEQKFVVENNLLRSPINSCCNVCGTIGKNSYMVEQNSIGKLVLNSVRHVTTKLKYFNWKRFKSCKENWWVMGNAKWQNDERY